LGDRRRRKKRSNKVCLKENKVVIFAAALEEKPEWKEQEFIEKLEKEQVKHRNIFGEFY
jgi:hypothetical protein